jgi:hypothetical protein
MLSKQQARERAKQVMRDLSDPVTGKVLPAYERDKKLRNMEREKRIEERKKKAEAAIEAVLNPPAPATTFKQLMSQHKAQDEGRRLAQEKADAEADANRGPVNPYRAQADVLKGQLYRGPSVKRQYDRLNELAEQWQREQAAAAKAAAAKAAQDADPQVANARESSTYLIKMAEQTGQQELVTLAQECAGVAAAGDWKLYWQRARAIESSILALNDAKAAERRAAKTQADADYQAAATEAQAAKARLDHASQQAEVTAPAQVTA